uniref:Uncharacterized protein n=1 Tax=Arundo donax TaxID=35708 RepID=A0A0A9DTR3_ARUDO
MPTNQPVELPTDLLTPECLACYQYGEQINVHPSILCQKVMTFFLSAQACHIWIDVWIS